MSAEVVFPKKFAQGLADERVKELRDQGILVKTNKSFDELKLTEPQYGETIVGEMLPEEVELFENFFEASDELETIGRGLTGRVLKGLGDAVIERAEDNFMTQPRVDDADAKKYFRLVRRVELLKATLFWQLGDRFDCHEYTIGIRTKRRVIKGKKKFENG